MCGLAEHEGMLVLQGVFIQAARRGLLVCKVTLYFLPCPCPSKQFEAQTAQAYAFCCFCGLKQCAPFKGLA